MKTINKPLAMTLFLLVIAFPVCGLAAYKAYSGPKLPKDQVAIVTPDRFARISPVIGAVDGQEVPKRLYMKGSVAVKPGKHTLAVTLVNSTLSQTITFEAEAGHTYVLYGEARGSSLADVFWIEDKKTKQVVAGLKPTLKQGRPLQGRPLAKQVGPLHEAAAKGDLDEVNWLILMGAKVKAKDKDGHTPLHKASINGHTEVADVLIAEGAKVEAKNNDGATPLHAAAHYGHTAVAELLIAKGAKVNRRNKEGATPLRLATDKGHKHIVELLKRHGAKE